MQTEPVLRTTVRSTKHSPALKTSPVLTTTTNYEQSVRPTTCSSAVRVTTSSPVAVGPMSSTAEPASIRIRSKPLVSESSQRSMQTEPVPLTTAWLTSHSLASKTSQVLTTTTNYEQSEPPTTYSLAATAMTLSLAVVAPMSSTAELASIRIRSKLSASASSL